MKNILLVENSSVIITFMEELFSKSSQFTLYVAQSYGEAKSLMDEQPFFIAVSNLVLNDALNGEILELFDTHKLPNIVLTSNIDDETLELIHSYSVIDYVLKSSIHELSKVYELVELLYAIEGRSVLVVDDSNSNAALLKDCLNSLMLDVKLARNGSEALDLLKDTSYAFSLLITDYNMDNMNGLELIQKIRKDDRFTQLPIIAMSTHFNDNNLKIALYKYGTNDFIQKPILFEELKTKVINIFANQKQLEDIQSYNTIFDENVISSTTDIHGVITDVSQAFCDIAGYSKEEMIGQPHSLVRHPDMPSSIFVDIWDTIQGGNTWRGEIKNLHKNGGFYWVKAVIKPHFNAKGEIQSYTSIRQDITDKKHIYELSVTDGLTSLFNRRYFNDEAQGIMAETIRNKEVFGFIILDVDNFKKYNDNYGHQAGDVVLKSVAKALNDAFRREEDKVYRLGGEEFGITLSAKSLEDIQKRAEIARHSIESLQIEHKQNPPQVVTASFGLTVLYQNTTNVSLDALYQKADEALYQAKESGRNKVCYLPL